LDRRQKVRRLDLLGVRPVGDAAGQDENTGIGSRRKIQLLDGVAQDGGKAAVEGGQMVRRHAEIVPDRIGNPAALPSQFGGFWGVRAEPVRELVRLIEF